MVNLLSYFFSAYYLKPIQVFSRLSMLTRRKVLHRSRAYRLRYSRSTFNYEQIITPLTFADGIHQPYSQDEIGNGVFTFLNRRVNLGKPIDWFPQEETQLWRYNLHYFDYVIVLGKDYAESGDKDLYKLFRQLVKEWMQSCPVAKPVAWDSYPVSLRLSNWIKAYSLFEPAISKDIEFLKEFLQNLYVHASYLEKNIEYHLLGNHLIENGRALLLAGLFFTDDHADRWQKIGERILWEELDEQFLRDGGHFERSPMYHQIMLNLYREVISILKSQNSDIPSKVTDKVKLMELWLGSVLHPDGQIALLNDSALGIAGDSTSVLDRSMVSSDRFAALSESGYFAFRDCAAQNYLIFDCGPLGPDYLPGHGHCDTLSFELSLERKRIIVDSGVGNYYGDIDWRSYYRSTRAHNTVVIDGAEQSEIWGRFRVARRARPLDVVWADNDSKLIYAIGSHTGYHRLPGSITHRRWMCWIDRSFWLVCDQITGRGRHSVESFIHFDPEVEMVHVPSWSDPDVSGEVKRGSTNLKIIPWGVNKITTYRGETDPIQGWVAPEFGLNKENKVWGFYKEDRLPIWFGYVLWPNGAEVRVDHAPIDENTNRIDIKSAAKQYQIFVSYKYVKMEIGE
jgi:uncharacterized heparinase superfamily protein